MPSIKLCTAIAALSLFSLTAARSVRADDETLVRGRAAYSPAMTLSLLKKVEGFCSSADKSAREMLTVAVTAWQKRHADLLRENARVREELQAEVNAPGANPGLKAELDNMFNKRVPQQVETDYKKLVPPDASKGWASKSFVCGANASTIEHGQYDLERFDPEVAAYLRKRIAQARPNSATP
jgi:hypothetical protein